MKKFMIFIVFVFLVNLGFSNTSSVIDSLVMKIILKVESRFPNTEIKEYVHSKDSARIHDLLGYWYSGYGREPKDRKKESPKALITAGDFFSFRGSFEKILYKWGMIFRFHSFNFSGRFVIIDGRVKYIYIDVPFYECCKGIYSYKDRKNHRSIKRQVGVLEFQQRLLVFLQAMS
ncbi:MAG: hypothetical protein ABH951_01480 [Patescibacteria group bacterium]